MSNLDPANPQGSPRPIAVLLVEDEPGDAGLARIALRGPGQAPFALTWAQSLAAALAHLKERRFDVVLLDLGLPDANGLTTLAAIRSYPEAPPVIVLTGQSDAEFGLATLKSGAADYLVKGDFGYDGLPRTILYTLHRVRLERELEQHRLHLEDLVARRTAELAQAKEVAEAANRAKTVFLANMSHELRTPLNAILGFAQLLTRDPSLAPSHRDELQTIHRSGEHLLGLINNVLAITSVEAGRVHAQSAPFDLEELLALVTTEVHACAQAKGLAFAVERQGSVPGLVQGDADHLRQVLLNLLGNAVKFTDSGVVRLRVAEGEAPGQLSFTVSDSGPGIAPADRERIFEPFHQTELGIALGEGAGLGLTLSREFTRLMGGELRVDSQLGHGACFQFVLALPPAARLETPSSGATSGIEELTSAAGPEADLSALPDALRDALAQAAIQLDQAACLELVERLRAGFPAEARHIAGLVQAFRFDRLMVLCDGLHDQRTTPRATGYHPPNGGST